LSAILQVQRGRHADDPGAQHDYIEIHTLALLSLTGPEARMRQLARGSGANPFAPVRTGSH
jgi:hypothetical protein